MTTTPTSGAADLPEALRRSAAADGKTELFNLPGYPLMVRAVDFNRLHAESEMRRAALLDEMQKAALAAGQATAAPAEPDPTPGDHPQPCDSELFESGVSVGLFDIPKWTAEALCKGIAAATGARVDWHYIGGRVHVKALPAPTSAEVAAYATLPENYYLARGEVPTWDAKRMHAFADATHALRASHGQAPATQQAGEVRRAELVPGVMHCAKCKFQLNRVTLCVSDGNAYAGNNKTEPCPNGCGPLWPVTWEQEAKNCWKALEEMHERLMAAAAPQPSTTAQAADSVLEDAARYRWLRERSSTMFVNVSINGGGAEIAETLDLAVDAARKQGEKQ